MKPLTFYIVILFLATTILCQAQIVNIPDINFKNKLLNHDPIIDTNNDSEIQFTEAEALTETLNLDGTSSNPGEIADLTGIEAFVNIDKLQCSYNQLASIDLSFNTALLNLVCNQNPLTSINISNNTVLRTLSIYGSQLTSIDVSNNDELILIQVSGNLTNIDVSNNPVLQYLYVQGNQLTNIDVTNNPILVSLTCEHNQLTQIDLSSNPLLNFLHCRNNNLTELDLSNNTDLRTVSLLYNNELTYLNIKNGYNNDIITSGSYASDFTNLPNLETVCIDDVNSSLATFIEDQVGYPIIFTEECLLTTTQITITNLIVYPNPVNEKLNIQSQSPIIKVEVYNLLGQLLISKSNKTAIKNINTTSLNTGVYFIRVTDQNNNYSIKQIIKK
ncbi:MAG: T9SS type A sorting domain-containing protein [Flavobacteriaceae bacterium]|nr:T9SS type A sorting domain-containing protein [Flavobacteriaceae bacterium]